MSEHSWDQREDWTVCTVCGAVRNYDRPESSCRGAVKIALREATGGEQGETAEIARLRRELDDARADISVLRADRDRIRTVSAEALALRDRLATIVDEAFGQQEVLGMDALLSRLEHLLAERALQHEEVRANYQWMVERAADQRLDGYRELGARAAAAENARDDIRRELTETRAKLDEELGQKRSDLLQDLAEVTVALRDLVASVATTNTRDTIVLRDLEAARAVLGGGRT